MNLKRIKIIGYRSIRDEQSLPFDPSVTVLIGANDHGKSNLLSAIRSLNDDTPFTEADRHWDLTDEALPHVEWELELTPDERAKVRAVRPAPVSEPPAEGDAPPPPPAVPEVPERVTFARQGAGTPVIVENGAGALSPEQGAELLKLRPRVELFESQKSIADEIQASQLDEATYESMKGIFLKAGLWDDRARLFSQDQWSSRQLAEASTRLTDVLRQEWEQGRDLEWKFEHAGTNGTVIRLLIKDPAVRKNYVRPSQRSSGFTSFFILSLTVFARTFASPTKSFIYLFDEPGTYLHPIAQVNLQRVFESLAERAQIAYATHSIFLVNKNVPTRNRVVRKDQGGTVVDRKPFSGNWKAVRNSLGITLAHNFLISDRTLLVEGPSDAVYIAALLLYLIRSGASDLDLNDFSIADAGTSQNMLAMTRIMLEEGRKVVVMLDGDKHGSRVKQELEQTSPRELRNQTLTILQLAAGKSIEDLVPRRMALLDAAVAAARALVTDSVRELSSGKQLTQLLTDLEAADTARGSSTTLGTMLEKETKGWFQRRSGTQEPLSKLQIAVQYEDALRELSADADNPVGVETTELVGRIRDSLKLQPRKAERAIFESATDEA